MKTTALLLSTLLTTYSIPAIAAPQTNISSISNNKNQVVPANDSDLPSPQEVQQTARKITVRITSEKNGGSGVLIAKKGSTYLVLTNAHVTRRANQFQIQAPDGQKYTAKKIDGGFDAKYDLALLQFTSDKKYALADLTDVGSPLETTRTIYSAGFPFDSKNVRITSGQVSQLSDISFDDGTQIGYTIDKGKKEIRQGMSGGAILDGRGKFLGINTLSAEPIAPNYTYNDGSKPLPKLAAQYRQANWGVPVYNFLTKVKPEILYGYDNLPKIERQVTPTGYMARLNEKARKMTVRIESDGGNGSGVVIAKEGNSYYVLTAKHVVEEMKNQRKFTDSKIITYDDSKIITYDQEQHAVKSTVVAKGVDLAVVKFSSNNNYNLAQIRNYSPQEGDLTFVGGFPARQNIKSPLWQWQLNAGAISDREEGKLQTQDNQSFSSGYDLIYNNISYGGMSGGPVLDTTGNVIGLHGKVEGDNRVILGRSLGISIQTFTGLLSQLQVKPQLLNFSKSSPSKLSLEAKKTVIATAFNIIKPLENSDSKQWLEYANQLYRTLKFNESVKYFDKAIAKGEKIRGNYGKSLSLYSLRKLDLAHNKITEAIGTVPKGEETRYYYFWKVKGLILRDLGRYDESLMAIDTAIKLNKNDSTIFNEKASLLHQKKQFAKAIQIYDEIIKRNPEAYAYSNRGLVKADLGDKKGAILNYDQAIKLNPNFSTAYSNRGIIKFELGDKTGAVADFNQAIKINPESEIAYSNRGLAKYQSGDKTGAFTDTNKALELNPKFANAYYNRGGWKYSLKDKQGAVIDYGQAIKYNPNYAKAYSKRGLIKYGLGDKTGAIADYNQALKIDPQFAEAYYRRGDYKSVEKDHQGAINDFNQAIKYNPKYDIAYVRRGMTKYLLGDKQGAINDYTQAAELSKQQGHTALYQSTINMIDILKAEQGKK